MRVCVRQRVGHFAREVHGVVDGEHRLAFEAVAQCFSLDVRHDVVQQAVRVAGVEERQDMRMLQRRGELDLTQEPLGPEHGGQLGVQHLDGDLSAVARIAREVHRGHAAASELPLDRVPSVERRLQGVLSGRGVVRSH